MLRAQIVTHNLYFEDRCLTPVSTLDRERWPASTCTRGAQAQAVRPDNEVEAVSSPTVGRDRS